MRALDTYWINYDRCLDRVASDATTVDELISIVNEHYDASVGVAFFPGGSERSLLGTLLDSAHWRTAWVNADYHFCARDKNSDAFTYVEGDIYRGAQ